MSSKEGMDFFISRIRLTASGKNSIGLDASAI